MSTDHTSENSVYILNIFLAEVPSGASGNPKPEYVLARRLAARALESYLGHKPSPEVLAGEIRTPEGRPYFQDYPDFHYNISTIHCHQCLNTFQSCQVCCNTRNTFLCDTSSLVCALQYEPTQEYVPWEVHQLI